MRSVGNIFLQACQSGCEAAVQVWCPAKHRASPEHHQEARLGSLSSCWAGGCSPGSEVGSTDGRCGREKMHAAEGFVKEMGWFAPQPQGTRFLVRSVWQLCCPAMSRWNISTGILKTFKTAKWWNTARFVFACPLRRCSGSCYWNSFLYLSSKQNTIRSSAMHLPALVQQCTHSGTSTGTFKQG